jgi:hypothetical protein
MLRGFRVVHVFDALSRDCLESSSLRDSCVESSRPDDKEHQDWALALASFGAGAAVAAAMFESRSSRSGNPTHP